MEDIQSAIVGKFENAFDAYEHMLSEVLKEKYKIEGDEKIEYDARAFIELKGQSVSKHLLLNKDGINFLDSFEKYGDKDNIIIQEECEYCYDIFFNLKKLETALSVLKENKSSKKSIINIAAPPKPSNNEIPSCMTYIAFRVINNKLNMSCHMRADNAYRILLADLLLGQFIHEEASKRLGLKIGKYYHIVDSLHVYRKEVSQAKSYIKGN